MDTHPIVRTVNRYYCPFCNRGHMTATAARNHIGRCWKNSAARGCKTCAFYEPGEKTDWTTGYPGAPETCGEGLALAPTLRIGCAQWSEDGSQTPPASDGEVQRSGTTEHNNPPTQTGEGKTS